MQGQPQRSFSSTTPFLFTRIDISDITTCFISQSENGGCENYLFKGIYAEISVAGSHSRST
jgi:hypothetical protein